MTAAPAPSVASLRKEFGEAIERHVVSCGDTIVYASLERVHDVLAWLKDTPGENYNYLTDITAVDYRDPERALEVVWQIRALDRPADLRVKVAIPAGDPLEVRSVWDLWRGANWLERAMPGREPHSRETSTVMSMPPPAICPRPATRVSGTAWAMTEPAIFTTGSSG